jgi:hypothetical protein
MIFISQSSSEGRLRGREGNDAGRLANTFTNRVIFGPEGWPENGSLRASLIMSHEVLVTKYPPGAGIGWHRDAPAFDIIVGVSLLSECTMQFRPWPATRNAPKRTRSLAHVLEPRSAYILRGSSRTRWQHHVPPAKMRRLSITFRTLRNLKNR